MVDDSHRREQSRELYRALIDGGFSAQSVIESILADDLSKLRHTGRLSVQLQPPNEDDDPPTPVGAR